MKPFSYMRALSIDSAVGAASAKNRLMSGGIDLLGELKEGLDTPEMLIAIKGIPGLDTIEPTRSGWRLGANVTLAELAGHEELGAALDGAVLVRRRRGLVRMSIAQLYDSAWKMARLHHSLAPGDMITAVELPAASARCAYLQQSEKSDFDWALVSCAAMVELDAAGIVRGARIALGAVAPVPYRDPKAEESLLGQALDESSALAAADILLAKAKPLEHNAYKIPLARALIQRALLQAIEGRRTEA